MIRAGTYSIVAHDPATGEVGVAVQSHWFSVGSVVPWTRAGVGAVAVQSVPDAALGPRLLDRLASGDDPGEALRSELAVDDQREFRQVGVVRADGRVAAHTGARCLAFAGDTGGPGFSCQANIMASARVWGEMAAAFSGAGTVLLAPALTGSGQDRSRTPRAPLARRMLAALVAGEAAGGDVRGRQSCAIAVAPAQGDPWRRTVDLRVEDHAEPLEEIARLLDLHDAYAWAAEGDDLTALGRTEEAGEAFRRAAELAPDNHELLFWAGLAAVAAGREEEGLAQVRRAVEAQPGWAELLPRLPADFAPAAPAVARVLGLAPADR